MLFVIKPAAALVASLYLFTFPGCQPVDSAGDASETVETTTSIESENTDNTSGSNPQDESQDEVDRCIDIIESSGDKYARADAAAKLSDFEDQYERFAKPLSKLLVERDEVLSGTAIRIFDRLGKKGVEALEPDFDGELQHLRLVCSAINAAGDGCEDYIPQLLDILKQEDDMRRRAAATFALTGFSKGNADAIDLILRDLEHPDMNVTLFAMRLIIKTGKDAKQASPKLVHLFNEGVPSQRGYAIWALAAIAPTDDFDAVKSAGEMLNRFTVSERERGLIATGLLGKAAEVHKDRVKEMMAGKQTNVEGQAAITWWQITGDAETAVNRLMELSRDAIEYELNGLKLIAQMGPAGAPAIDLLMERVRSSDPFVQAYALDALKAIGSAGDVHEEEIHELFNSTTDPLVKLAARDFLESLEMSEEEASDE